MHIFHLFRLQQIESEFFKHASISETARTLDLDLDVVDQIFQFWILKRKVSYLYLKSIFKEPRFIFSHSYLYYCNLQSNRDRPLLPPKTTETERLSQQQQQDMERMKLFVQLRQDLERVNSYYSKLLKQFLQLTDLGSTNGFSLGTEPLLYGEPKGKAISLVFPAA